MRDTVLRGGKEWKNSRFLPHVGTMFAVMGRKNAVFVKKNALFHKFFSQKYLHLRKDSVK